MLLQKNSWSVVAIVLHRLCGYLRWKNPFDVLLLKFHTPKKNKKGWFMLRAQERRRDPDGV